MAAVFSTLTPIVNTLLIDNHVMFEVCMISGDKLGSVELTNIHF